MMPSLAKAFPNDHPTSLQISDAKTLPLINPPRIQTHGLIICRFNSLRKIKLLPFINLLLESMVVFYVLIVLSRTPTCDVHLLIEELGFVSLFLQRFSMHSYAQLKFLDATPVLGINPNIDF
jgi:hypothetical protein